MTCRIARTKGHRLVKPYPIKGCDQRIPISHAVFLVMDGFRIYSVIATISSGSILVFNYIYDNKADAEDKAEKVRELGYIELKHWQWFLKKES